jgi:hypothetical protein
VGSTTGVGSSISHASQPVAAMAASTTLTPMAHSLLPDISASLTGGFSPSSIIPICAACGKS